MELTVTHADGVEGFARRLNQALDAAGYPPKGAGRQVALAKAMGISQKGVRKWLEGEGFPSTKRIQALAELLGVSFGWLISGKGSMQVEAQTQTTTAPTGARQIVTWETPDDLPPDQYVLVERRRVKTSAGEGALVFEEEQGPPLAFATRWIKREQLQHRNLVIVEATGDSMEPGIQDGDSLLVDLGQTDVVDGRVYVIRYRDELRVKRLFTRYDGALILRSDNHSKYPDEPIPPEHLDGQVEVIGRVVWRAGGVP